MWHFLAFKKYCCLHRAYPGAQWWRIRLQCGRPRVDSRIGKIPWKKEWQPAPVVFPENFMDREAWQAEVIFPGGTSGEEPACQYRRPETWVQFLGQEDPLEEGMATRSSILVWTIPWTEEPGGLQSIGLRRVRHNWKDSACTHYSHMEHLKASYIQRTRVPSGHDCGFRAGTCKFSFHNTWGLLVHHTDNFR